MECLPHKSSDGRSQLQEGNVSRARVSSSCVSLAIISPPWNRGTKKRTGDDGKRGGDEPRAGSGALEGTGTGNGTGVATGTLGRGRAQARAGGGHGCWHTDQPGSGQGLGQDYLTKIPKNPHDLTFFGGLCSRVC